MPLQVDGVEVIPDKTYPGFEITMNGRYVRLATNFSLIVESDGQWISLVKIPLAYFSIMEGICGDSDEYVYFVDGCVTRFV